jgi:hypothetical protein
MEFHVHTNMSNLIVNVMSVENPTGKCDQSITYAFRLLNNVEKSYTTIKREVLMMVYVLHKYHHHLFGNKFFFHVDHMAFLYLIKNPQVFGHIV